jgi:N-acetylneuraminate synthase
MKPFIIAEAGVNHNGDISIARELVRVAATAGADAVKFQTFRAADMVTGRAAKASYQKAVGAAEEGQLEMLRRLELSEADHRELTALASDLGIEFMSTPFDHTSLQLLVQLGVRRLKIGSGDLTNCPLLYEVGRTGLPVILSTGMSVIEEIEVALGAVVAGHLGTVCLSPEEFVALASRHREYLRSAVTILHCTSAYPTPAADVHLRAMGTLRERLGLQVGYSDHTVGIHVAIAAAALGATMIEKHFTLDRTMVGPDHAASIEPDELSALVSALGDVERALGLPTKEVATSERDVRLVARKSLVARREIRRGEPFTADNIAVKRPGDGMPPVFFWRLLGCASARSYEQDEPIARSELSDDVDAM